jgi:uncharacterized protein
MPLSALDDPEGTTVDPRLPPVVDAHVHFFPDRLFEAIWSWFETHGWPIRYKLYADQVAEFLKARGVQHAIGLHYAHKPGIARSMNAFMAGVSTRHPFVTGMATVCPGEEGAAEILKEAFALGLRGVKLHCHVQAFAPNEPQLGVIYQTCAEAGLPLVMHAGREPKSAAYKKDTYSICNAEFTESVLRNFPKLTLCVPHLGADEFDAYERLLLRYDNLWLDTTMMLADYFATETPARILAARPERIVYGTDFPNLPYAWDRELKRLEKYGVTDRTMQGILGDNAKKLFQL